VGGHPFRTPFLAPVTDESGFMLSPLLDFGESFLGRRWCITTMGTSVILSPQLPRFFSSVPGSALSALMVGVPPFWLSLITPPLRPNFILCEAPHFAPSSPSSSFLFYFHGLADLDLLNGFLYPFLGKRVSSLPSACATLSSSLKRPRF